MPRTHLDRSRVALSQPHEVKYLKSTAKVMLNRLKIFKWHDNITIIRYIKRKKAEETHSITQVLTIRKICKALIKLIDKKIPITSGKPTHHTIIFKFKGYTLLKERK